MNLAYSMEPAGSGLLSSLPVLQCGFSQNPWYRRSSLRRRILPCQSIRAMSVQLSEDLTKHPSPSPAYESENRLRETWWLSQWDSWTSSRGGEGARVLGLIPSGCPGPHARGYRLQIGTTSPNQRLQSRPDPAA